MKRLPSYQSSNTSPSILIDWKLDVIVMTSTSRATASKGEDEKPYLIEISWPVTATMAVLEWTRCRRLALNVASYGFVFSP